ncbi:1-deoxy-D-xylulose-5-phosphate synthase [Nocardia terpenica]|uniref:1-deoxy-D-xylulose-5-phosphate synthase n=1 Tax=Nocardia terpenica TaxID=455432 RepID=A0A164LP95_9NOCA|nr:1-deoxy-D-xylulose-5-phosphate synthase [Nocardia terpenica]KZM72629.1 1-deoxy-D-xylulose-5-phosphate synthase [Nocardia terpenica]NQE92482.1 1-deoxy-D-xylulose-5-phosphate synthase [Nocardia terpenica]
MTTSAPQTAETVRADSNRSLLPLVSSPEELQLLPIDQLPQLAAAIRALLLETVLRMGGHLGPNLGVVELTIALHRVFDSPRDILLFDTGHQTYVHKILTGRGRSFARSLRQPGGLSGYPNRHESRHDVIENSHASTALSYADGIAKACALQEEHDRAVVAVVGDGALTGGLAFEALNNIGAAPQRPVIVVLNDNGHSYSPTAGALAAHLHRLRTDRPTGPAAPALSTVFEHLGLNYLGPVDGHDFTALEAALRRAHAMRRPVVVHVVTIKGQGYPPACADPERMHTTGARKAPDTRPPPRAWTEVFADVLVELGSRRTDVVAITAAMPGPTGLVRFAQRFPQRCFDVGIAEQHAVASAAGLATAGMHPVVAVYSTFLNRAFDQVLLDVALHRLPVTFVLDRAGVTGPDGPSHHGMWDLTLLNAVPGLRVAAPRDATSLRELLGEAVADGSGPTAVRFPKASVGPDTAALERLQGIDVLHRDRRRDVLLVGVGPLAGECVQAARRLGEHDLGVTVIDPRWVLPVSDLLIGACLRYQLIVVAEDNTVAGGVATALQRALTDTGARIPVRGLGLAHRFLAHGGRAAILAEAGLTGPGIAESVLSAYHELVHEQEDPS